MRKSKKEVKPKPRPHIEIVRDLDNWGVEVLDDTQPGLVPMLLVRYRDQVSWLAICCDGSPWGKDQLGHMARTRFSYGIVTDTRSAKLAVKNRQFLSPDQKQKVAELLEYAPQDVYSQDEFNAVVWGR